MDSEEAMQRAEVILRSGENLTTDMIGLPNPPAGLSPATQVGWYSGGYLLEVMLVDDMKRMYCVAKGIEAGVHLVENAPAVLLQ